jgi:hypothetical protein
MLLWLLLLLIGLATDKPAAAAKPSACCGANEERPFASLRSNASLRKLLHPFLDVPDEDVLGYNLQWPELTDGSR